MFQKFYTDTIIGRFIKHLLSVEKIPYLNIVSDYDILIKDCLYIYKNYVIKCVTTGKLSVSPTEELYPSDKLYPSVVLFPNSGEQLAQFKVIRFLNSQQDKRFSYSYMSTKNYYDSETHRFLGEYLRFLKGMYHLDLMPFYNCYNQDLIDNIQLRKDTANVILYPNEKLYPSNYLKPGVNRQSVTTYELSETETSTKVLCIPIKFNKTYTIAIECNSSVILRGVILSNNHLVKDSKSTNTYLADHSDLVASYRVKQFTRFSEPFTYSIHTASPLLYKQEKNLRLLIQLPASNRSSITVLEGDYTKLDTVNTTNTEKGTVRIYNIFKNLSLLQSNTYESYAFSDRLIEYLLQNVICNQDGLTGNISRAQIALRSVDKEFDSLFDSNCALGVWDNYTSNAVSRFIDNCSEKYYLLDQDGNINKDVESLFVSLAKGSYNI